MDLLQLRQVVGAEVDDQPDQPSGQEHSSGAAECRQHQTFSHQLTRDAAPAGTKRTADRKVALPLGGVREQQVGNVGTCHQEDQPDRAEQQEQGGADVSDEKLPQRQEGDADTGVGLRVLLREARADSAHFMLGLRCGPA